MSVWNVFNQDAFTLQELTATINALAHTPTMVGDMGIFQEQGVATLSAIVEELNEAIALLGPKPRGSSGHVVLGEKRKVHNIGIPHIPERATIMADEVAGVRAFGSESEAQTIEAVRDQRLAKMRRQIDLAIEYHRLLALKGSYMDNNGTIQSAYTLLGGSRDSVDFVLGTDTTKIREKCLDVIGHVEDGVGGSTYTQIHALCSPTFWKKLITHKKVEETYLNTSMAASLRGGLAGTMEFGDVIWHRYRGGTSVNVDDGKAYAFPVGVPGDMFITRFTFADYVGAVNKLGLPYYAKAEPLPMDKGLALEAQSNPFNICLRPTALVEVTSSN
ncbi:MAG: major capsid protein [Desulfurellales bacterium]|nr:MAG: major capsid protein [Desulfurellales bacterium]